MKIIAPGHEVIESSKKMTEGLSGADGKIKDLVGSGKVGNVLTKANTIIDTIKGGSAGNVSQAPEPTKEGLSTGAMIGIGAGVILLSVVIYMATKKK